MLLINPYRFSAPRSSDADVNAYLLAVESADGQQLEDGVIAAVETFVLGCKFDGIWSALKASCILAGARTLNGALVPLVGTAPTNINFVAGDYNRETGLKGNTTTKRLDSNRNNTTDPQNSRHLSCYILENATVTANLVSSNTGIGSSLILQIPSSSVTRNMLSASNTLGINRAIATGFNGVNRPNSTQMITRQSGTTQTHTYSSATPLSSTIGVFSRAAGTAGVADARISFYSIGESLDLAALDSRVSNLMTALAAAIP